MLGKQSFFAGKVALITGGATGIGLAIAKQLTMRGARVWITGRRADALAAAGLEVQNAAGQNCNLSTLDVTDASRVASLVAEITKQDGTPDLVINSAGVTQPGYVHELGLDVFREMMEINYFGTVNVVKAVLPWMMSRGSGHIVNISSGAGFLGVFGYSAYGASKYAVRGFSDVLRVEMKPHGIRVSIVFPPDTDTPQLAYEAPFKPYETKAISGNAKVMSANSVASAILKAVQNGKYLILPGVDIKLFFLLSNLLGSSVYPVMDMLVVGARRKFTRGN